MKWLRRVLFVSCGIGVGLVLVEAAFRHRDHGAFPHLNVYRPDGVLGVRLRPGATERISFGGNPVSSVRINAEGYRGADWPSPSPREVIVVGDSQTFGLGVEERDTFEARLADETGRTVINAGVPTYGPREYSAVANELFTRKPGAIVYVINLANDLFEAAHPNRDRHVVYDGWAVRRENAPRGVHHFPGRTLLFRDSHAFFALRRAWLSWSATDEDVGVPSEGTWEDLLTSAQSELTKRGPEAGTITDDELYRRSLRFAIVGPGDEDPSWRERAKIDNVLEKTMRELVPASRAIRSPLRVAAAHPGDDVVANPYAESARLVPLTAEQIARAAELRRAFEEKLRDRHDDDALQKLARRDSLEARLNPDRAKLYAERTARQRSALRPYIYELAQQCRNRGIQFVVVVLPLDVQVSKDEWAKYGAPAVDLSATKILSADLVRLAADVEAPVVDAWPVLAAAEPGAFLDHDLHMSAKGHAALADALAKVLP